MSFIGELKRRNVLRVAGVYAVVGWLLVQVAAAIEEAMFLPAWFDTVVVSFLALGFPVALIFAWAFELTPEGIRQTKAVAPEDSITGQTASKLDLVLIIALLLFSAAVFVPRLIDRDSVEADIARGGDAQSPMKNGVSADGDAVAGEESPPPASIAVLPFADLSPNGDREYFADGISEELLNVLAKIDEMKVAGRTSSFAFKGRNLDLREIGRVLQVAHILEGSVRSQGQRVRVTAQLVQVSDGYHLWSETYDGDLGDIFAVQDDIARQILAALKDRLALESTPELAPATRTDVTAYDLFLEARDLILTRDAQGLRRAIELLDQAIAIDAGYAPAYAARGKAYLLSSDLPSMYGDIPVKKALESAEADVERALELDPRLGDAHAVRGVINRHRGNADFALASLRHALELSPSLLDARNWLALELLDEGRIREALDELLVLRDLDPLFRTAVNNAVWTATMLGDTERATRIAQNFIDITSDPVAALDFRAVIAEADGRPADALELWFQIPEIERGRAIVSVMAFTALYLGEDPALHGISQPNRGLRAIALALLGRHSEALELADQVLSAAPEQVAARYVYIDVLSLTRAHERLLDYFDGQFVGDLDVYATRLRADTARQFMSPLEQLARAASAMGNPPLFEASMQRWRKATDRLRAAGANAWVYDLQDARYWALRGDATQALDFVEAAVAKHTVLPFDALTDPVFDAMTLDPRFVALRNENGRRINAEREALGWPPLPERVLVAGLDVEAP